MTGGPTAQINNQHEKNNNFNHNKQTNLKNFDWSLEHCRQSLEFALPTPLCSAFNLITIRRVSIERTKVCFIPGVCVSVWATAVGKGADGEQIEGF
jgi:hypothetical protein